jgi:TolA-binding protein
MRKRQEVHVHKFHRTISGFAAAALLASVATLGIGTARARTVLASTPAASQTQAPAKKAKAVKDRTEYDLYTAVLADVASNPAKALAELDTWKQKYPDSDFKDDRSVNYILAYAAARQPARAVDEAAGLLGKDLNAAFDDPKSGPKMIVNVLYTTAAMVQQIPDPTPEELATGQKAARMLMDFNRKPEGVGDADWTRARGDLQKAAKAALLYLALKPGADAMQSKDYAAAEAGFSKALQANPDSALAAYRLGASEIAQQSKDPAKISLGLYEIARAVAIDPGKSDFPTPEVRTQSDNYLKNVYALYHGSEDGLDQLKQQALAAPTPPAGFYIMSAVEISARKNAPGLGSVYVNAQDAAERLQLNGSDGSFSLLEGGQKFSGTYTVNGNVLTLHIAQLAKDVDIAIDGSRLVVNGAEIWVQPD